MRVVFVGQAQWCADLAAGISRFTEARASMVPIDHIRDASSLLDRTSLRQADLVVRVGFRPAARTARGRAFDALFHSLQRRSGARMAYLWLGTDVLDTLSDAAAQRDMTRFRKLTDQATHVAVSFHLRDELASVGVKASVAWIPARHAYRGGPLPPLPHGFTVLSYVPEFRHQFYGGPYLLDAARRLPEMSFRLTAASGTWAKNPPDNVTFLDRIAGPRMADEYIASSCFVRMVRHDGFSGTVIEALSYGRNVVYSLPFPHTHLVEYGDAEGLVYTLRDLARVASAEPSGSSLEAARWAQSVADEPECYATLLSALTGGPGRVESDFTRTV